ncbi:MAG: rRNA (guanosine2251-2-O)-methyltransferase [Frankiaceae bacterium]|nr:rRNA (guanosine2251-2-O)-methyltransferase [Frankiaceae bacterium]
MDGGLAMAGGNKGGLGGRGNKAGSHRKGAAVGSGGNRRRALEGKGPTPPASARKGHPAQRKAAVAAKRAAVTQQRAKRTKEAPEVVAGRNAVVEALRAGVPSTALHVAERIELDERVRECIKLAKALGIALLESPRAELDRITNGAFHQGIALAVPPYSYAHPDDLLSAATQAVQPALLVALDGVTDPRNLGAVVRSAAAFGAHGVLVPERRAAGMTASAWKTSAGTAARIPVARATNLTRSLKSYQEAGLLVVGLAAEAALDITEFAAATDPLVLVAGSEGQGLSRLVSETCDLLVRIPMPGEAESLNAGVATGIALYEVSRRRSGGA